eukprot:301132-Rhodomonas_salina.3
MWCILTWCGRGCGRRAQREVVMRSANKVTLADILDGPQLLRSPRSSPDLPRSSPRSPLDPPYILP